MDYVILHLLEPWRRRRRRRMDFAYHHQRRM
jgi:hypothetical protein